MRQFYRLFIALLLVMSIQTLHAQRSLFTDAGANTIFNSTGKRVITPEKFRSLEADPAQIKAFLWSLPAEKTISNRRQTPVFEVPMPNGTVSRFNVWHSSIMEPGLEAKYPEMRQFLGQGIDDPYATIRFDFNPYFGFSAQILTINGNYYIDPYARGDIKRYISYYTTDNHRNPQFICNTLPDANLSRPSIVPVGPCRGEELFAYRLAMACTGEYAVAVCAPAPPTVAATLAAIITSVNRVTGVYEKEAATRMILIANTDQVIYLNGSTDPYSNNNGGTMLGQNQTNMTTVIGTANFDIGHVFSTGGGGVATLNSPCNPGTKARGVTGLPDPVGDDFDIDFVAHEMGHQFGGNHPFNGANGNCSGGNRNGATAYEPGSGTTIMAYAGICGSDDLQPHSDPYFHSVSFDEISTFVSNGGSCKVATPTGNTIPVITSMSGNGSFIPLNTPFTLTGTATDADGDALTYSWEEWDLGAQGPWNGGNVAGSTAPLFRARPPKSIGSRTFPDSVYILANYLPATPPSVMGGLKGEKLPTVQRTMKFRLTVRDNKAGGGGVVTGGEGCGTFTGAFQITAQAGTGPFVVTSPNGGEVYGANTAQTVTWDVAGTFAAPISATNVKISISTDGGATFPTVLVASTPNDGSELVTMPNSGTTTARIKIEAVGNIFFDVSNANFTITPAVSGFSFNTTTPSSTACGSATAATVTLGTTANGGFTTPIVLSATAGVPAGTTIGFTPGSVVPGNSATITLNNANTLTAGTYAVTITGTAGTLVQTTDVVFNVTAGAGPSITTAPVAVTVCEGQPAVFSVTASNVVSYQWQVNSGAGFTNISGATTATLNIASTTSTQNGNTYQVVLTGQCNTTTSTPVSLTVQGIPAITVQPAAVVACVGTGANFSVTATGAGLTYQWQRSATGCTGPWTNVPGAMSSSLNVPAISLADDNTGYRVIVSGTCGAPATSDCVLLTVGNAAAITVEPVNTIACEGDNAVISVTATGSVSNYQWQVNTGSGFTDIPGANTNTLTLSSVTTSMTGNQYLVNVFSCTAVPIVSATVTLTVNSRALITTEPSNASVCLGTTANFSAAATGTGISYQWQYAADCSGAFTNIPGATNAAFDVANATLPNAGAYRVVVTGTCYSDTSACVTLTVNSPITILTQPTGVEICLPVNTAQFSIAAAGTGITYQWQVSTDGGANWTDISGETASDLSLTAITAGMNGNQYRVVLDGTCTTGLNSSAATLAVNSPVSITEQPEDVLSCAGSAATFTVVATGSTITYQWQVSINGGPFVNVSNAAPFSGATTSTLTVDPLTTLLDGYAFRVIVTGFPCGSVTSNTANLVVNTLPVVVLTAASNPAITPYIRTTLYTTVSPAGTYTYQWYRNGVLVPSQTGDRFDVTVDDLGEYEVVVTDNATGCSSNASNKERIDFIVSDEVFIYPNPSGGQFQVRYYSSNLNTTRNLCVYDSKGARVWNRTYTINSPYSRMDVNLDNAGSGIYHVEVKDSNGKKLATGKVVIR